MPRAGGRLQESVQFRGKMYSVHKGILMIQSSLKTVVLGSAVLCGLLLMSSGAQAAVYSTDFESNYTGWNGGAFVTGSGYPTTAHLAGGFGANVWTNRNVPTSPATGSGTTSAATPGFARVSGAGTGGSFGLQSYEQYTTGGRWDAFKLDLATAAGSTNMIAANLQSISFDITFQNNGNTFLTPFNYPAVWLYSDQGVAADVSLYANYSLAPIAVGDSFTTTLTFSLTAGTWFKTAGSPSTSAATQAEILALLGDLDALYISADWVNGADRITIDNFNIGTPVPPNPEPIPEPSSIILLLTAGIPAMVAYRRRKTRVVA